MWLKEKKDAASANIISTLKKNEMDDKLLVSKLLCEKHEKTETI